MSSDCNILNPLQRDGASRLQRLVDALRPEYVSVDERSLADLLVYARKVASLLQYYNLDNIASGDWVEFIENDISTLVALVAATDYEAYKETFDAALEALDDAADVNKPAAFAALFPLIVVLAQQFDRWYRQSVEGLALHGTLFRFITSVLSDAYRSLIAYAERANEVSPGLVASLEEASFSDAWSLDGVESDVSLFQSGTMTDTDEIEAAARRVAAVFEMDYEVLSVIVNSAPDYLQETLDDYPEHQPHMALFLAFLSLFNYAQDHLNEITKEHLNFYYQEVLQLDYKPEQPDEVHLVFELAKTFFEYQLKAGTPLKAGKDNKDNNLFYNTDDEIVINTAALSETDGLKTIFIDKTDGTLVKNIYAAPDADSADGKGAEIEEEDGKWKTFGSTEMPYAEVGFAIASPILLLAEGTRTITVTFVFENLPDLIKEQIATVRAELEHNVRVELSGAKAWIPATVTGVPIDASDATITFEMELSSEDKAIVAYNKDVLDHGFETEYPVMRFVFDNEGYSAASLSDLNNINTLADLEEVDDFEKSTTYNADDVVQYQDELYRASATTKSTLPTAAGSVWEALERSYPYRYFQPLTLQRLVLYLDVKGVQNVILENDLGVLNPAKPFMPFGPVPKVGSSLYVGSHEIFQKRLLELDLHVAWGDVPQSGFVDHYADYMGEGGSDLFISYDLHSPGQRYDDVIEAIEALSDTVAKVQRSFWYAKTDDAAAQVRDTLWALMDDNDTLLVLDVATNTVVAEGLSESTDSFLTENLGAQGGNDLFIAYDLHGPDQNYDDVIEAIEALSGTVTKVQESFWYVKTADSAEQVRDTLRAVIDANDSLLVLDVTNNTAVWEGFDQADTDLLNENLGDTAEAPIVRENEHFKAMFQVLRGGAWTTISHANLALFEDGPGGSVQENRTFSFPFDPALSRQESLESFTQFSRQLLYGFLRVDLRTSFLHTLYPKLLAEAAMNPDIMTVPNQPYTPLITGLSLDYASQEEISFTELGKSDYEDRVEQLFHIYPFGQNEFFPIADDDTVEAFSIDRTVVPVFEVTQKDDDNQPIGATDAEGSLYLGLEALDPPQNLAVLFQVAEGSADPEKDKQDVVWSYLAGNTWIDFETAEILSDKTNGLLTSGIIQFAVPKEITDDNTAWPSGLHWLRASVAQETDAVSQLIAVRPQAVKASFDNQNNDPNHLATALEDGEIKKLKVRQAAIKTIEQPYASFDGRMVEQDNAFYVRVSERLRHKQRAVTIFDYERLVLEAFPEVYKVKCINHTDKDSEYAPSKVKLIVVPDLRNKNAVDRLQPRVRLNTLDAIKDYLSLRASDFVALDVKNPTYELVQVEFKVEFHQGKDRGHYTTELEKDVIKFLSPWLDDEGADLAFGGRIHRSWILNFIEERDYVDFVTDFQMHHTVAGVTAPDVEEAVASTSSSVLVSAAAHTISETNVLECQTTST